MGAHVRVYDPEAMKNAAAAWPTLSFAGSLDDAVRGAGLVIVATEWREFRDASPAAIAALADGRIIIDARNCLDAGAWIDAGWTYRGMGRYSA
jgi:UDPglucose 6-dehydrogenase